MDGGDDRGMRHRIKDLKLEAQSMILDESWARQKEKLMDSGELDSQSLEDKPLMPRHTITESAAAVTLLLDQLTIRHSERSRNGSRDKVTTPLQSQLDSVLTLLSSPVAADMPFHNHSPPKADPAPTPNRAPTPYLETEAVAPAATAAHAPPLRRPSPLQQTRRMAKTR